MNICTEIKEVDNSSSEHSSPGITKGNNDDQKNNEDELDFKIEHKLPHLAHIYNSFE